MAGNDDESEDSVKHGFKSRYKTPSKDWLFMRAICPDIVIVTEPWRGYFYPILIQLYIISRSILNFYRDDLPKEIYSQLYDIYANTESCFKGCFLKLQ